MNTPFFQIVPALFVSTLLFTGCVQPATTTTATPSSRPPINVLLITADDLGYESTGVTGSRIPGLTPQIDRLAAQGMRFAHAHVTSPVCQPSRSALMTGRYPYRNGALGFEPIRRDVPTLQESLRKAGYLNGIMAKVTHLAPRDKFQWDFYVPEEKLGHGRDPAAYYQNAKAFFLQARNAGRPFFLMANSQDPHRPFAGAEKNPAADGEEQPPPKNKKKKQKATIEARASVVYTPEQIEVPLFLADLPGVREELAQYYTSTHRCDETVGEILRALRDAGCEDNTLVMFLSDNGMSFPFAKTTLYRMGTHTPWIVRWPSRIKAGAVNDRHMISGVDFMPTILDSLGLPQPAGMDGRSFLPLLEGREQADREQVYTVLQVTSANKEFPSRCIQTLRYGYIYNSWPDGKTEFKNEAAGGKACKAMEAAAEQNPSIAERTRFFRLRTTEELYDYQTDPFAQKNLAASPEHAGLVCTMRERMHETMKATGDPTLESFEKYLAPDNPR